MKPYIFLQKKMAYSTVKPLLVEDADIQIDVLELQEINQTENVVIYTITSNNGELIEDSTKWADNI